MQWSKRLALLFAAWAFVGVWLIFGGVVLSALELREESKRSAEFCDSLSQTLNSTDQSMRGNVEELLGEMLGRGLCRAPPCKASGSGFTSSSSELDWRFAGAAFFCLTTITTIGYGSFVPVTVAGKIFTMFFAVVGIGGFLTASALLAAIIQKPLDALLNAAARICCASSPNSRACVKLSFLFSFLFSWLLVMAGVYAGIEGWSMGDAIYFSFISLTTIGLGDLVPTESINSSYAIVSLSFLILHLSACIVT